MRDIGTAINFLHSINIAHRDIKVKKALNGLAVPYLSEILVLLKQSGDSEVTQPTLGWRGFFCRRTPTLEPASS